MTDETPTGLRKLDADTISALMNEIATKDAEIAGLSLAAQVAEEYAHKWAAEADAMLPVVEAAVAWGQDKIVFHRLDDALLTAVRAYETKMKEVE